MRFALGLLLTFLIGIFVGVSTSVAQHDHEDKIDPTPRRADGQRSSFQQEGLRENPPRRVAIVGATLHRTPLSQPNVETILIEGTKIVAIGADLELPPGTKTIDGRGKHCYPGFIDSYVGHDLKLPAGQGTSYWNANVRSELKVAEQLNPDDLKMKEWRDAGFTAALVAPSVGIIKGQSSLVLLSDFETEHLLLANDVAQHLQLTKSRGSGGVSGYPNSPMGAVALARQAMYDAQWYQKAWQVAQANPSVERPEVNTSLSALSKVINGSQMVMVETSNELFVTRADRFAREFGLKLAIIGNGNEYRRLDDIAALGRTIVLPINFPKPPDVSSAENAADSSLEDMMHWDHAPANPGRLAGKDVRFVFTTDGLKNKGDFLKQLRLAVKRGLSQDKALGALTVEAARFFGVEDQIGSLEKNMIANITITDGDLFDDKTKIVETWVDGVRFSSGLNPERKIAGNWTLDGDGFSNHSLVIKSRGGKLSGRIQLTSELTPTDSEEDAKEEEKEEEGDNDSDEKDDAADKKGIEVKPISLSATRLTGAFRSDEFGQPGVSLFSLLVNKDGTATGLVTFPNGETTPLTATLQKVNNESDDDDVWGELMIHDEIAHANGEHSGKESGSIPKDSKPASFEVNYPLGAYGRQTIPAQPKSVLIKNVTVWSLDDRGKIENGSVLLGNGLIESVFESGAELPDAEVVIDATGHHVTPGIIDCHSHMATDSGVNESGQAITAEVRIGDLIDPDDITIYRQLAGGVTAANVLHGSANPIGGQNQVIKLRWGLDEQGMKFDNAPLGIKFALGENVKQSNRSQPSSRYPQTRMGVEQIIDDAFRAAKDYRTAFKDWEKDRKGLPPRRDLELDALLEIVEGQRWVHCHSYRQDEILALIRTLESHGITIGSFQHILEGYKVADQMAEHGAMASAFADWWAYKYEVKDAIPFAGALMHRAGVVVSFNSDDGELGRHLNQEAAKAVKYGGVSEVEALKFVTLNPARQLRIDDRVGSLESGKDADLVLWSGHPLSNFSTVKQTWVDGRKYFDRDDDTQMQAKLKEMRLALIQKILQSGEKMEAKNKTNIDPAKLWPRFDEFCHGHGHVHDE